MSVYWVGHERASLISFDLYITIGHHSFTHRSPHTCTLTLTRVTTPRSMLLMGLIYKSESVLHLLLKTHKFNLRQNEVRAHLRLHSPAPD